MGFDVVLFAGANTIEAGEGFQSGEDALDTRAQVSMHPFLDCLEDVRFLDASHLDAIFGQLLLWKSLKCVVWTVDLVSVVFEQPLDLLFIRFQRLRPTRVDGRQQRTGKPLLTLLSVSLTVEPSISQRCLKILEVVAVVELLD